MSTRAIYTFMDDDENFPAAYHVYKHHDGDPSGAAEHIGNAIPNAWELPRFEADEFGAAFVASNKAKEAIAARKPEHDKEMLNMICQGGVRLMPSGDWKDVATRDIQFRYEISCQGDELWVRAWSVSCSYPGNKWTEKSIFEGPFTEFKEKAETIRDGKSGSPCPKGSEAGNPSR